MFAFVTGLLNALVAIPKIADQVEKVVTAVIAWWVGRSTDSNIRGLSDALAMTLRSKTRLDRINAAKEWREALSKPRTSI